jgi:hypothetical protein
MAIRKPVVFVDGQLQQLQSGDDIDGKARVSSGDTSSGYLADKILADGGIDITVNNPGGSETLTLTLTDVEGYYQVMVSANDNTVGFLNGKLVAGSGITLTENNNGGDETLTIAATGGGSSAPDIHPFLLMGA